MGYTILMDARGSGENKYYGARIINTEAKEKNRFAPDMTPNAPKPFTEEGSGKYTVEIHITGIGNLTLEEYPIYIEAMQIALPVAQELQGILNQFIENN